MDDSPISILHEDMLWKIFLENTGFLSDSYFGYKGPLITARHCSQVCRRWRCLFLSSPSIWGRLIDFEDLRQKTDDWRNEVVARSGEALLWVYGSIQSSEQLHFLLIFLKKEWKRVQILDIEESIYPGTSVTWHEWAFLKAPAPKLSRIRISMPYDTRKRIMPAILFKNDAPCLEDFRILDFPYKIPTNTSWLPHLTSVALSEAFTTEKMFAALEAMPQLVYLTVKIWNEIRHLPARKVVLPNLRMLETNGDALNATPILQWVAPSSDCCLSTWGRLRTPIQADEEYEQYESAVKSYVVPYFSLHPPSILRLHLGTGNLILEDALRSPKHLIRRPRHFYIMLDTHSLPSSLLVKELVSSKWSSLVSKLVLSVDFIDATAYNPLRASYIYVLQAFSSPSITTLHTGDSDLFRLLEIVGPDILSSLFPNLITLGLKFLSKSRGPETEFPHQQFLRLRRETGRPISVLDLSDLWDKKKDMGYLEEHTGLLVRWKAEDGRVDEYVCGEGHPERLCFSTDANRNA
ncbi:hypothetical protein CPC08DRAFT_752711 [Agrocybe pediades]|nr:hypothetical protein CPC08DRAFT_752711 [Agrocybe pediades]